MFDEWLPEHEPHDVTSCHEDDCFPLLSDLCEVWSSSEIFLLLISTFAFSARHSIWLVATHWSLQANRRTRIFAQHICNVDLLHLILRLVIDSFHLYVGRRSTFIISSVELVLHLNLRSRVTFHLSSTFCSLTTPHMPCKAFQTFLHGSPPATRLIGLPCIWPAMHNNWVR